MSHIWTGLNWICSTSNGEDIDVDHTPAEHDPNAPRYAEFMQHLAAVRAEREALIGDSPSIT